MQTSPIAMRQVDVAAPMRMMFRIKDYDPQRGFTRYFWKSGAGRRPAKPRPRETNHGNGLRDKVAIPAWLLQVRRALGRSRRPDGGAFEKPCRAGIEKKDRAAWLATAIEEQHVGKSCVPLAVALRLPYIRSRASKLLRHGTEAFRGAVYAVASGAAASPCAGRRKAEGHRLGGLRSAAAVRSTHVLAEHVGARLVRAARAAIATSTTRSPRTSARMAQSRSRATTRQQEPKAHLTNRSHGERAVSATIAEPLGLYDCCGVSDGSACAIVTTPEIARSLGKKI